MHFHPKKTFWLTSAEGQWAQDREGHLFLARATRQIGLGIHGAKWTVDDFVHLGAPEPKASAAAGDDVDRFLVMMEYQRALDAHTAGTRAQTVVDVMLTAAAEGRLVLLSLHPRASGAGWYDVPRLDVDPHRSQHVFTTCSFNPSDPFNASPRALDRENLFVTATSLDRVLRGLKGAKVPTAKLQAWARANTAAKSQQQMMAAAQTAFPGYAPPTQAAVKLADAHARTALGLAPRRAGAPTRGGTP